jgi:hypothetical protein
MQGEAFRFAITVPDLPSPGWLAESVPPSKRRRFDDKPEWRVSDVLAHFSPILLRCVSASVLGRYDLQGSSRPGSALRHLLFLAYVCSNELPSVSRKGAAGSC